jgi:hypothetical protein
VIFPRECKEVGFARTHPCGDRVYFLSRYLVHPVGAGYEILQVDLDPQESTLLRTVLRTRVIATADEVTWYPQKVQLYDRRRLVDLAAATGTRCTLFSGLDEHLTFVLDPDPGAYLTVHVYDVMPPRPSLSASLQEMEASGLFGDLDIAFQHHVRDLTTLPADLFPCQASGFDRTLDVDIPRPEERIAACQTGIQILRECHQTEHPIEELCPLTQIEAEPFIARCCHSEQEGIGIYNGRFGAVVHWAAPPWKTARLLQEMVHQWRMHA